MPEHVIAVVGPTAAGKSDLALRLSLALGGEVVNADSMQLYAGMDIGTAKLSPAQRRGVPHHLLDIWDVRQAASVAEYQRLAREAITGIHARGRVPVLAGGSGLYLRAALDNLEFPGTDPAVRDRLEAELATAGAGALLEGDAILTSTLYTRSTLSPAEREALNRPPQAEAAAGLALLEQNAEPLRECHERQLGHLSAADLKALVQLLHKARAPHEPADSPWK